MQQRMLRYGKLGLQQVSLGDSGETLFHNSFKYAPTIAKGAQITLTINTRMLYAGYLEHLTLLAKGLESKSGKARNTGAISWNAHQKSEEA